MAGRSGFDYRQQTGRRVLRTTRLTSGAGVFVPLSPGVRARVVLQAGGGGGSYYHSAPGCGGGAGAYLDVDVVLSGSVAYIVGAAGAAGTALGAVGPAGSDTSFGALLVSGGAGGTVSGTYVRAAGGSVVQAALGAGLPGGAGGLGTAIADAKGYAPGTTVDDPRCVSLLAGTTSTHYGCGGSSVMGQGGDANSVNGAGYGAGGRGGMYGNSGVAAGAGSPGIIIVEEYE